MSIADKALWIIERNSERSLALGDIAAACGVSRSHLANAFGCATGLSVMKYLRSRRLSTAAHALADGAPDIFAVALDAGYGSHEAFTRAFREQFGRTPESVRDRRSLDGLALVEPLELKAKAPRRLAPPRFVEEDVVRIVGLREPCSFESTIRIPAQWQRFMPFHDAIPAKLDRTPTGVSQAPDDDGQFDYTCGVEVSRFGASPGGLRHLEIPSRRYAVFEHRDHVSTVYESYLAIWNEALPDRGCSVADAPTLERHDPAFDPRSGEGGLSLWIPLADPTAVADTRRTVQSYEGFARHYNTLCDSHPPPFVENALRRMVECVPRGGRVLEIGSGPGRDADFVESLGVVVRRTDATQAFLDLQAERGRHGERLDVVTDELGGPYDAVLAMGVLIHVDRTQMDPVLRKIAGALEPGGALLVSMRKGEGETRGDYHTVYWTRDRFAARLAAAGLALHWDMDSVDSDDDEWITFLARRPA